MSGGLPLGWETITLGELSEYITSGSRDWSQYYSDQGSLFIRTQDIKTNALDEIENIARVSLPEKVEGKRTRVFPNDILITITGANVGKVALVPEGLPEAYVSQSVALVRPISADFSEFLHKSLMSKSDNGRTSLQNSAYGQGRPVLSLVDVREVPVSFPPLPEQRRIVRKLDILGTRSKQAHAHLTAIKSLVERYKIAIIRTEIERVSAAEMTVREVASVQLGKMLDKAKNQGTQAGYLANINVRWFSFDLDTIKTLRATSSDLSKFSIKDGDLIVCEGGEPGRAAIWNGGQTDLIIQKALMRVRCNSRIRTEFLLYWLFWQASTLDLDRFFTGSTIKHLPKRAFESLVLPVPKLEQQREIVARIEWAFTKISRLAFEAEKALKLTDRLDQRLLAKAFAGELVPQDPNDEPASELLAGIRASRLEPSQPKRGRKKAAI